MMIALYSVNLRIMSNKANIPLFNVEKIFDLKVPKIIVILVVLIIVKIMLDLY